MSKKKNKHWVWLALCRKSKRILGYAIGTRGKKTGRQLWQSIQSIACQPYCTDYWEAYQDFLPADKHRISKKGTQTIESYNSLLRHYLARPNRKTKCYTKSIHLLECILDLFIYQINLGYS